MPRHGAHPPKLNGCGKLQIVILSGSLTDKAVKSSKRRAAEASLDKVIIGSDPPLENVPHFEYLGSRLQCDGSDEADVRHRLEIAQSAFS